MIRGHPQPAHAGSQQVSHLRTSTCSSGYFTQLESNNVTRESLNYEHVKCVLLGDGAVGKTSLIISYTTNGYPSDYTPTTFDTFKVDVKVEDKPVHLEICDTAGQEDFDALRPLCFSNADAFLLCFSVVSPASFANIRHKWFPELKKYGPPSVPIVLVGTQSDLRDDVKISIDLANAGEKPVSDNQALELAKSIDAVGYIECSALTAKNLKSVFDTALLVAMEYQSETRESHGARFHNVSKKHSSAHTSRHSANAAAPKKRSQSTSSTNAPLQESSYGKNIGSKLSASSSCTSPPFVIPGSVSDSRFTPKPSNKSSKSAIGEFVNEDQFSSKNSLPSSPTPSRPRQKIRSMCCF